MNTDYFDNTNEVTFPIDWEVAYDYLEGVLGIDSDALDLAFAVGGCNLETAERILFYYTGWRTFEGWLGELNEEEEED